MGEHTRRNGCVRGGVSARHHTIPLRAPASSHMLVSSCTPAPIVIMRVVARLAQVASAKERRHLHISPYISHMVAEPGRQADCAAWRIIASTKQKEMTKDNEQQAAYTKEHVDKLEADLQEVCDGILALTDKNLIPKVFYYKMKSNLYRYLAECATGDFLPIRCRRLWRFHRCSTLTGPLMCLL